MPKLHSKEPTLNGRAYICAYADREYLYLRIPVGNRKYSNISSSLTNKDGRISAPFFDKSTKTKGVYEFNFYVGEYFENKNIKLQ